MDMGDRVTTPESVGLSSSRLVTLDRVMAERYVTGGMLPGLLTQVYRQGALVHTGMAGHMDLERSKAMREDAIFRIYSMTKPITSVALMMLVEEGMIGLDDAVHTYIPSWKNLGVYASGVASLLTNQPQTFMTTPPQRPMKVVDLVTHTSGLTYGFLMRTSVDAAYRRAKLGDFQTVGGLETMIQQLAAMPLEFSPGTAWNYSLAIDVMGYLVEKVSGLKFSDFLRTRLFEPLGMTDTAFWCPPEKLERFTSCYQPGADGGLKLQDDGQKSTYATPPALESGGGGLVSTAHDYMRFCQMMLHGGALDGVRILSPKTVQLFSLNHLDGNRELAAMAPAGAFSEFELRRHRVFDRLRRQYRRRANSPAGHAGGILLGRRRLYGVLDRSEGRPDRGVHDPGHGLGRAAHPATRSSHAGLFRHHRIVRLR